MNIQKKMQIKVTFLVFTLLFAVIISGAASAALAAPVEDYPSAYVVENNYSFTGPNSIQDAIDNYETLDGYNIEIEDELYQEQLTINKNISIKGLGSSPHHTVIYSDNEIATITIGEVSVVLENLSIWNVGNGQPINNNGLLNILNCYVNGRFIQNQVTGSLPCPEEPEELEEFEEPFTDEEDQSPAETEESVDEGIEESVEGDVESVDEETVYQEYSSAAVASDEEEETSEMSSTNDPSETNTSDESFDESYDESCTGTTSTEGTSNYPQGNGTEPAANDPGIPLGSLAYGMLMVMGGTVATRKNK
ncbi:hypothetical protein [Methanobacterium sp. MZD130B]|uniref:hypothetical protein n=1 Tax=Methanobacterium sp. MZD130B TaxID=3394378 RepID=UPI0039FBAA0B